MSKAGNSLVSFYRELRRRKIIREAAAYVVVAWLLIEVADIVLPAFDAPEWILPAMIIGFAAGLPFVLIASWLFDLTSDGLERTEELIESPEAEMGLIGSDEDGLSFAGESQPVELKPSLAVEMGSADRRQVTLLRCTFSWLNDGNSVSEPDGMLSMLPRIEKMIDEVSLRFTGTRLAGAGGTFEILFGSPIAYENDAVRAVVAGLSIINETDMLADAAGSPISASVAIHSELSVIEISDSGLPTLIGTASQVASWMLTLTAPGTVTLEEATHRQLRNRVSCDELGMERNLQMGVAKTIYRAREFTESFGFGSEDEASTLVLGRESELVLIMDRWERAMDHEEQFVVLRGEAGIGKSTLVRELTHRIREAGPVAVIPMFCSPFASSQAFYPIVEYLVGSALQLGEVHSESDRVASIGNLLTNLGLDERRISPMIQTLLRYDESKSVEADAETRTEMLNCLLELLEASSKQNPVSFIIEDLHWSDPSTLEFVDMLVSQTSGSRLLCLFTGRPSLSLDWDSRSKVTKLDLQKLSRRMTEKLVNNILGETGLNPEHIQRIVAETEGNPLFAEELSKAIAEAAEREPNNAGVGELILPGTLQQSLTARMDNLGSAKPLLQLCSLLGRKFDYELLKAVSRTENEISLQADLSVLVKAEFLHQEGKFPHCQYAFKHILMQETANQSLLRSTRTQLHTQVAEILEQQFSAKVEREPELLAYHYEQSAQLEKAVDFWTAACQRTLDAYALQEAITLAESGLRASRRLPETEDRNRAEITLTGMKGQALLTTRAYADPLVEQTFSRALALSEAIGEAPQMFTLVLGLWMYFQVKGEYKHSITLAQRLLRIAETEQEPWEMLQANYCCGFTLYYQAEFQQSRKYFEKAIEVDETHADFVTVSGTGDDTRIHVLSVLANVFWHLNEMERAVGLWESAFKIATELDHPHGIVWANFQRCMLAVMNLDHEQANIYSARTIELAEVNGIHFFLTLGQFFHVWSSFALEREKGTGDLVKHVESMKEIIGRYQQLGCRLGISMMYFCLIEALLYLGDRKQASDYLLIAGSDIAERGERYYEPELARLSGMLAFAGGHSREALGHFERAVEIGREINSIPLTQRALESIRELGLTTDVTSTADAIADRGSIAGSK